MSDTREMRSLAYHEAAHASVAVAVGHRLERVELTPGGPEQEGVCRRAAYSDPEGVAGALTAAAYDPRPEIVILLAGRIAEQIAGVDLEDGSDLRDVEDVVDFAMSACGSEDEMNELIAALEVETRELLTRPDVWAGVERLAAELLRVGAVDGIDAERIIHG